jgi:hypothetical protein
MSDFFILRSVSWIGGGSGQAVAPGGLVHDGVIVRRDTLADHLLGLGAQLTRMVLDAHLHDTRRTEQLVLVENVAEIVLAGVARVVPFVKVEAVEQRRVAVLVLTDQEGPQLVVLDKLVAEGLGRVDRARRRVDEQAQHAVREVKVNQADHTVNDFLTNKHFSFFFKFSALLKF